MFNKLKINKGIYYLFYNYHLLDACRNPENNRTYRKVLSCIYSEGILQTVQFQTVFGRKNKYADRSITYENFSITDFLRVYLQYLHVNIYRAVVTCEQDVVEGGFKPAYNRTIININYILQTSNWILPRPNSVVEGQFTKFPGPSLVFAQESVGMLCTGSSLMISLHLDELASLTLKEDWIPPIRSNVLHLLSPLEFHYYSVKTQEKWTSPIDSIMCNAGELPLQRRRQSSILQYTSKIKCLPNHISNTILHNTLPANQIPNQCTIYENFKIFNENLHLQDLTLSKVTSSLPPWLWTVNINTQLSELNKQYTPNKTLQNIFNEIISQHYPNYTQIYTDTSKNINGTGFAVITENDNYMFSLPHSTSIYTAETYAIYEAVKIVVSSNSENSIILSDSFSAITSIINPKNELVQLIQKSLSTTDRNIFFMWVPSHVGIPGNEKADTIANKAILSPPSTKISKITTSDAIYNIKKKKLELWQNNWSSLPLSNKFRNIKPYVKKWKNPPDLSRREEVVITRVRIGHTHLTHSYLISKEPKPTWETCKVNLSIKHIMIDCPKFSVQQGTLNNPSTIQQALNEDNTKAVLTFLRLIKIFNKL
ncbi:hypothetical protein QTP88_012363 [Uroleucon formosanum]